MRSFLQKNLPIVIGFLVVFFAGWQLGFSGYQLNLRFNPPQLTVENKRVSSGSIDFSILWEVLDRINTDYLFRPVDGTKLLYGAVSGLVKALGDPYTAFLDPAENRQFGDSLKGIYEGIGAELGIRNDQLMVVAPLDGSPAQQLGIRPGDKILEIDGVSTAGLSITEAVSKIRGRADTAVDLTLQRGDQPAFKVTITRARITVKSVRSIDKGGGIYYVKVSRFGDNTGSEWDEVVAKIKQGPVVKGIVLDLRSNSGGYLTAAAYLSSEFLRSGTVVIQEDSGGRRSSLTVEPTKNNHAFVGVPVVVLIDGGSASAAEIIAAALKERGGAILVGERSFGKGTVQDAEDFADGSGLHLSVAKWLTPSGKWIHEKGLEPDHRVALTDADINADRDPPLDKALELLRSK